MTHVPYGYKIVDAKAVINEPVAEKVRLLFSEYLACGSMRAATIKVGIEKTHSVIGRLLTNKVYLGTDYYPQIIDGELFQKVQKLRTDNAVSQNRLKDFSEKENKQETYTFSITNVELLYEDPYKQAEYAYGLIIQEVKNE